MFDFIFSDAVGEALAVSFPVITTGGCTDVAACNYDSGANSDDGSCEYAEENFDCDGNCLVDVDCLGECNGDAVEDECAVCDNDSSNDCVQDCNGDWGGTAEIDECGVCDGDDR